MTAAPYRYKSDFARRYFAEGEARGEARGEAKGEADAVLEVLSARGIPVDDESRQRIAQCTDINQLRIWVRRAVTANTAAHLFT